MLCVSVCCVLCVSVCCVLCVSAVCIVPTSIRTGAVAVSGMLPRIGEKKTHATKSVPATTLRVSERVGE